ncbi:DAK2 domain-containing protein [Schaalia suimastitidis]|uniref:DAK2 domain-containing protein n=1 Tax=Schaalia suimastitidis TaxID=121163 RepID=UPI0004145395|nr:DAK2 domain-containing protein [Schaalia suimastitidis]
MPLDAAAMTRALRIAHDETRRLTTFLDDLDGWGNGDCDTGSNATRTFAAMTQVLERQKQHGLDETLQLAVETGIRYASGHVGILITALLAAWARTVDELGVTKELTPVQTRRMLASGVGDSHMHFSSALNAVFHEAVTEVRDLGTTLPSVEEIVSIFSGQANFGLIESVPDGGGRIDAGAAVMTILLASLDAATRDDTSMLHDLTRMLAELAARGEEGAPSIARPDPSRSFTVDLLVEGMEEDAEALRTTLTRLGARFSSVGTTDLFGIGTWRFHIDTSAPLAVRPRRGTLLRFHVVDSRPDDLIGEDTLSDGVTHRGIRLLERRPRRRVERATVLACTQTPGLVEDLARCGAQVIYKPTLADKEILLHLARSSRAGVVALVSCDGATHRLCQSVAAELAREDIRAIIPGTQDELSAFVVTRACAPIFVPQPGGREVASLLEAVIREAAEVAMVRSVVLPVPDGPVEEYVPTVLREIFTHNPRQLRLLLAAGPDDAMAPALRQLLSTPGAGWWSLPLEVVDGAGPGPHLIQGLS